MLTYKNYIRSDSSNIFSSHIAICFTPTLRADPETGPWPGLQTASCTQGTACPATWDAETQQKAAQAPLLNAEKRTI